MSKIDFSRARTLHRSWRTKLKPFINGEKTLTPEAAFYHESCEFGQWLYSEGMLKYGRNPQMRKIEKTHARLHTRVRELMEMKKAANNFGAERVMEKIEEMSEEIIQLLDELEKEETA